MTQNQERAIEKIRREAENTFNYTEIKDFIVSENEYFVSVVVTIGAINENALDRIFFRDKAHFFVGKRGGVTYPMYHKDKSQYCKRWDGSFLSAVVNQRENDKKVWGIN